MNYLWHPRRIGWRLTLGFACLIALMLLALVKANLQISQMTAVTQRFATEDLQRLLRVQALSLQTEGVGSALVRLMNAPRENRVSEYTDVDERNLRIDGIIESMGMDMLDTVQQDTLKRLIVCRAAYAKAFIATVDQIEADDMPAAAKLLNERVNPALKAMLQESNALLQRERESIEEQLALEQAAFERLAKLLIVLSALAVGLAVWLGVRTTRSVVGPLASLEAAAKRIAQGDYRSRVIQTSAQEVDRVGQALNTMTDAVAQREQQIVQLAYHDVLTGLPNRTSLLTPMDGQEKTRSCLVLMDLARLKGINETLGYVVGDALIKEVGQRTHTVFKAAAERGLIGEGAVVARLSGGTFAASFDAKHRAAVLELHAFLQAAMSNPVTCGGHSVDLNLAYGLADTEGTNVALSTTTLLRNAEVALHTAKKGALGFAWYSEAQEAARVSYLSLVSDLRVAVATSQLQMWLQPKFSLSTGLAVGAEALVRWQHPSRGFISPAEFVPFAEQTGHISMVTSWMLDQALRTLAAWAPTHPELSIAVNMSTRDLLDPTFCQRVQTLLDQHGVPAERLRLEIVESGLMDDPQTSVAVLHALRDMGIKLSIDDFGTGYSSLAYLQKLPVNELKIDRSFVDGVDGLPGTQRLVKTMIEMGHGMGLMVTAEGVETQAERDTITRLGCDVMQGYLGSRPLHGVALQAWFEALGPVEQA
jgi:diguanylate cyclase (GGDEF)-like protein